MVKGGTARKGAAGLSPRQRLFCIEYLADLNATQAAIRAGYSAKTADVQGPRLLRNVRVAAELERLKTEMFNDRSARVRRIEERIEAIALGDVRRLFEVVDGVVRVRDSAEWSDADAALVDEVQASMDAGEGGVSTRVKVKTADRLAAMKFLHNLLSPQVQKLSLVDDEGNAANLIVLAGLRAEGDLSKAGEVRAAALAAVAREDG